MLYAYFDSKEGLYVACIERTGWRTIEKSAYFWVAVVPDLLASESRILRAAELCPRYFPDEPAMERPQGCRDPWVSTEDLARLKRS
jgi:AcrR family transcriptional regulator